VVRLHCAQQIGSRCISAWGRFAGRLTPNGSPLLPTHGGKTLALFGDIVTQGGGTLILSGSHRWVYKWPGRWPPV